MGAIRWRWVAGILWGGAAVFVASGLMSNPFTNLASYGLVVLILATAVLIGIGGRLGVAVAALATAFAGLVTVMFALMAASSGCNSIFCPPPGAIAVLAVLTVASFLAAREINRAL
ncbi:MAG: hypothetical protein OEW24_07790 [Chloroflexota bacterium]|nr:hypothetical protein [Chloroflexota bacterium]